MKKGVRYVDHDELDKYGSLKDYLESTNTYTQGDYEYTILDSTLAAGGWWFAAQKAYNKKDGTTVVSALAAKTRDRHYMIAISLVSENDGPYAFHCPKRILKVLSPTDNEEALRWRGICIKRANRPKRTKGSYVLFDRSIGSVASLFKVVDSKRNLYSCQKGEVKISRDAFNLVPFSVYDVDSMPKEDLPLFLGENVELNLLIKDLLNED